MGKVSFRSPVSSGIVSCPETRRGPSVRDSAYTRRVRLWGYRDGIVNLDICGAATVHCFGWRMFCEPSVRRWQKRSSQGYVAIAIGWSNTRVIFQCAFGESFS